MRFFQSVSILFAMLPLFAGCSGTDDSISSYFVDEMTYEFYSCPQLAQSLEATTKRVRELERVIATASREAAGQIVNAVTYRPEYLMQRGNMNAILRKAREKHCDPSKFNNFGKR